MPSSDAPRLREGIPPCRNKSKNAAAMSEQEQAIADGDAALLEKVMNNDIAGVKALIEEKGQEVNVVDETGESAVHKAMRVADVEMFKLLVKFGAFADYFDAYGNRPINVAFQMGEQADAHIAYLLTLKDLKGRDMVDLTAINFKTGNTLLHDAAWVGNTVACSTLLKTGAFKDMLETTNAQGQTAMHIAAFRAPKDLVQCLVDAGADMNAVEKNGRRLSKETPEMMATAMGRDDTAQYLRDLATATNAVKFAARMKMKKGD